MAPRPGVSNGLAINFYGPIHTPSIIHWNTLVYARGQQVYTCIPRSRLPSGNRGDAGERAPCQRCRWPFRQCRKEMKHSSRHLQMCSARHCTPPPGKAAAATPAATSWRGGGGREGIARNAQSAAIANQNVAALTGSFTIGSLRNRSSPPMCRGETTHPKTETRRGALMPKDTDEATRIKPATKRRATYGASALPRTTLRFDMSPPPYVRQG